VFPASKKTALKRDKKLSPPRELYQKADGSDLLGQLLLIAFG
jgi:hypothetical protein